MYALNCSSSLPTVADEQLGADEEEGDEDEEEEASAKEANNLKLDVLAAGWSEK